MIDRSEKKTEVEATMTATKDKAHGTSLQIQGQCYGAK